MINDASEISDIDTLRRVIELRNLRKMLLEGTLFLTGTPNYLITR